MRRPMFYLLLVLQFSQYACTSSKDGKTAIDGKTEKSIVQYNPEKPQLLFLNLSIRKTATPKGSEVELVDTKVVDGTIKRDFPSKVSHKSFQLVCSFLDENKKVLKQTAIDHPLHKRYEYQNDQGTFSAKLVESDEGQFSLRTQLTVGISYLRIEETLNDPNQLNTLQTIKL
ncbi:MAG: hypothetical protein AAF985_07005 [Bacteroidota bacterium]